VDQRLFGYDEKWISAMERPKACGDAPVSFSGREDGNVKFKIRPGRAPQQQGHHQTSARKLAAFTFHPTDPFAISVQKCNVEYVVNFHLRKAPNSTYDD